jgi:hypothetical protein
MRVVLKAPELSGAVLPGVMLGFGAELGVRDVPPRL